MRLGQEGELGLLAASSRSSPGDTPSGNLGYAHGNLYLEMLPGPSWSGKQKGLWGWPVEKVLGKGARLSPVPVEPGGVCLLCS